MASPIRVNVLPKAAIKARTLPRIPGSLVGAGGITVEYDGSIWTIKLTGTVADVVGPSGATDNAIARFDGASGKLIKNSTTTVDDGGGITIQTDANTSDQAIRIRGDTVGKERVAIEGGVPVFQLGHYNGTFASKSATVSGSIMGFWQTGGYDGATQRFNQGRMRAIATETHSSTNQGTKLDWQTVANGATFSSITTRMELHLGLQIGAPTGGDKGSGTINAAGDIFKNNTAYTNPDYVLEHAYTGKIEKFADNEGAGSYQGCMGLDALRSYTRAHHRLPGISDEPMGVFERSDKTLEKIEELTLYVLDLHDRIKLLEAHLSTFADTTARTPDPPP
jgi:hypothetical protein